MTYQQLLNACQEVPLGIGDLIYVAIGCSQKWYQQSGAQGSAQEYPPFVSQWHGRRLCILIDPDLEEEPMGITQAGGAAAALPDCMPLTLEYTRRPAITFVALRKHFVWWKDDEGHAACAAFLHALIARAVYTGGPHMIVQDYSGADIRQYFPVENFSHTLFAKVLFDVTGGDAGCFVDFSKVRLVRDSAGHFVQPVYTPLWKLKTLCMGNAYEDQIRERYSITLDSAARCWRSQRGLDEARDWYAPAIVAVRIKPLLYAYGIDPKLATNAAGDPLIPFSAVEEPIFDLCAAVGHYMSHEEIYSLLTGDFDSLRGALKVLRDIALEEAQQNPSHK